MSRWLPITLLFAASLAIVAAQGPPPQGQPAPQQIPDEILVQFNRNVPNARRTAILSAEGGLEAVAEVGRHSEGELLSGAGASKLPPGTAYG